MVESCMWLLGRRLVLVLFFSAISATQAYADEPVARARVTFDRQGERQASAEGFADLATQRALTVNDPARIASISKLVTSIAVLRLVEEGKLDLDADASDVLGTPLRNPAFPDHPITLRMLLSHTSSLTDNAGYWNVPIGSTLDAITSQAAAWDQQHAPGQFFRYSNLNFPVIAQLMELATGERFDRLMRRLVLFPMRLDACFNWSGCNAASIARAVVLYDANRVPSKDDFHGQDPGCPAFPSADGRCDLSQWHAGSNGALFSPQGGLRISVRDLARIGRMLLNDGMLDGSRILQAQSVAQLATPLWRFNGTNGVVGEEDEPSRGGFLCAYGLAVQHLAQSNNPQCRDDLFADGRPRLGHSGNAYGLLSGLWIDRAAGTGVAYFATGVENGSTGVHSAFSRTEEAGALGW